MIKIVVTGSEGFLGKHLVTRLKKDNYEVIEWDIVNGYDVCNRLLTDSGISAIFHFACPVDPANYEKVAVPTLLASSVGTYNMLELAKKNQAKFLYVSSSEIYGDSVSLPYQEADPGIVSSLNARSYYGESKRFGEMATMVYHRYLGLNARIIRPFNIYGAGMRYNDSRVIPSFMRNKKEGKKLVVNDTGNSTRTFCYVEDFTEATMRAMFNLQTNGEVFNLGSIESITMLDLAQMISDLPPRDMFRIETVPTTRVGEQKHRCPDISKAKQLLDWQPITGLQQGLEVIWKSYQ